MEASHLYFLASMEEWVAKHQNVTCRLLKYFPKNATNLNRQHWPGLKENCHLS